MEERIDRAGDLAFWENVAQICCASNYQNQSNGNNNIKFIGRKDNAERIKNICHNRKTSVSQIVESFLQH
jgi:hypothetical protein